MRILSHYFVGRFLGLFSMVLAVAFLLLATIELVLNFDDVSAFGEARSSKASGDQAFSSLAPVTDTLRYLGLRLTSYYFADVLPIASFIAVFFVYATAGRAMELLAIEAGGIRPFRIALPVLTTALILSFANTVLHETVILRADQIWAGESHDGKGPIEFGQDAFWYHKGSTITNVARADPQTRTLYDVEIFERHPNGSVMRVVRADHVQIAEDGRWHVADAQIWTFAPDDFSAEPGFQASVSVVLDLDALQGDLLLGANAELLPLADLERYLASNPQGTSATLRHARARYHERLSSPWLVLVFAWLAMPFALRIDERGRVAGPAIGGVVALGLYFLVENAGKTLGQEALIPVGITPWLTMGLFSVLATIGISARRARR